MAMEGYGETVEVEMEMEMGVEMEDGVADSVRSWVGGYW